MTKYEKSATNKKWLETGVSRATLVSAPRGGSAHLQGVQDRHQQQHRLHYHALYTGKAAGDREHKCGEKGFYVQDLNEAAAVVAVWLQQRWWSQQAHTLLWKTKLGLKI